MLTSIVLVCLFSLALGRPQFEYVQEWNLWKAQHQKSYESDLHELDRHLVWLSNKKYIELHNANFHIFGYTLAMNHFGDMVKILASYMWS